MEWQSPFLGLVWRRKERLVVTPDLNLVGLFQRILPLVQKAISLPIASSALTITHGSINDIKHHCEGKGHSERLESQQIA